MEKLRTGKSRQDLSSLTAEPLKIFVEIEGLDLQSHYDTQERMNTD